MRSARIGLALGLALAMTLAFGQPIASAGLGGDIVFDGYCDGMHINIPSSGLGTVGTLDGNHTGCISGFFVGTTSARSEASRISTTYGGAAPAIHYVVRGNHNWVAYDASGTSLVQLNSGTWSFGTPPPNGRASASSGARTAVPHTGGTDIHLDGYCDGFHLNIPSIGTGTAGTVDGNHTGCVTGGFGGTTSKRPNAVHLSTTYGGLGAYPLLAWRIRANGNWAAYAEVGGVIVLVNSGTWSPGPPPLLARGAKPAAG